MGLLAHRRHSRLGVQFHPESIGTSNGMQLLANFLRDLRHRQRGRRKPEIGQELPPANQLFGQGVRRSLHRPARILTLGRSSDSLCCARTAGGTRPRRLHATSDQTPPASWRGVPLAARVIETSPRSPGDRPSGPGHGLAGRDQRRGGLARRIHPDGFASRKRDRPRRRSLGIAGTARATTSWSTCRATNRSCRSKPSRARSSESTAAMRSGTAAALLEPGIAPRPGSGQGGVRCAWPRTVLLPLPDPAPA